MKTTTTTKSEIFKIRMKMQFLHKYIPVFGLFFLMTLIGLLSYKER